MNKDIVIIGSGTAGLAAYRSALRYTNSVLLIESGAYGTTCARVGCMPSKLLIAAADSHYHAQQSSLFGIYQNDIQVDGTAVMQRVKQERDRFVGFVEESITAIPMHHKLRGHAAFLNEQQIMVETSNGERTQINCQASVIASGSSPHIPAIFHQAKDRLVINDDVFEWHDLPKSVAVFGPGVIGLELGQALQRLGVKVSLFGQNHNIGPLTDPRIKQEAHQLLSEEFTHYFTDSAVTDIQRTHDGVTIQYKDQGQQQSLTCDYLLAATGRRPNITSLNLQALDIAMDNQTVPIADPNTMQIGQSSIFIAGDASNQLPLLHEAVDQGKIAGDNAGRFINQQNLQNGLRRSSLAVVFSHPQIAMIGQSFNQLAVQRAKSCVAIGEVSFNDQGRSRVMAENHGHLRIYAEQGSGRLLGAEMIGPRMEHIAHLLAWAHQQQMTISEMLDMPFYHPVIEEGLRTALRDTHHQLKLGPEIIDTCAECGVGS